MCRGAERCNLRTVKLKSDGVFENRSRSSKLSSSLVEEKEKGQEFELYSWALRPSFLYTFRNRSERRKENTIYVLRLETRSSGREKECDTRVEMRSQDQ